MFLLKVHRSSCLFMICTIVGTATGISEDYHADDYLLRVARFETGYDCEHKMADLLSKSANERKEFLMYKYEQVKCGYVFSALMHLHLVRGLMALLLEDTDCKYRGRPKDLCFVDEVRRMVQSLIGIRELCLDELWLLYAYSDKTLDYLARMNPTETNGYLEMHDFVTERLDAFAGANCNSQNYFNIKSDQCWLCAKYKKTVGKEILTCKDADILQVVISENRAALNDIIVENAMNGLNLRVNGNVFGGGHHLYFNDLIDDRVQFSELLKALSGPINWETAVDALVKARQEAGRPGLMGIRALSKFQQMLENVFKAVIVRIAWRHIEYVSLIEAQGLLGEEDYVLYMDTFNVFLKDFVGFALLKKDSWFTKLSHLFQLEFPKFMERKKQYIIKILTKLGGLSRSIHCKTDAPLDLNDYESSKYSDNINRIVRSANILPSDEIGRKLPLDDTIRGILAFLGYLKKYVGKSFVFFVIRSFNKAVINVITN